MALGVLLTALAWSNGGPVGWNEPGGTGDLAPRQQTGIRLVSETLRIAVQDDRDRFAVDATYQLDNPGDPATVPFGVPLTAAEFAEGDPKKAAKAIRITAAAKSVDCEVVRNKADSDEILGWCVAEIEVPSGPSSLTLKYVADLRHTDTATNKSPFTRYGARELVYHLHPAGYWAGNADFVDVRVDPGPYAEVKGPVFADPPPSAWSWRFEDVDLKEVPAIRLKLDDDRRRYREQMATWNARKHTPRFEVEVSSVLEDKPLYAANKAVDGDPGTAWCANEPNDDGGWIELTIASDWKPRIPAEHCSVGGFVVIPGYARNAETWTKNNRIVKFRATECSTNNNVLVDVPGYNQLDPEKAVYWLPPEADTGSEMPVFEDASKQLRTGEPVCVRFRVERIRPGEEYDDTCISEIYLVVSCG